jgi:hypothetical protein
MVGTNNTHLADGLSLAMFEALRGLRDAVAPESGNLGNGGGIDGAAAQRGGRPPVRDVDELWQAYCANDGEVVDLVHEDAMKGSSSNAPGIIQRYEDFVQWHSLHEKRKDTALVQKLAADVLRKSEQIDAQVDRLFVVAAAAAAADGDENSDHDPNSSSSSAAVLRRGRRTTTSSSSTSTNSFGPMQLRHKNWRKHIPRPKRDETNVAHLLANKPAWPLELWKKIDWDLWIVYFSFLL